MAKPKLLAPAADLQLLNPQLSDQTAALVLEVVSASIRAGIGWAPEHSADQVLTVRPRPYTPIRTICLPARHITACEISDGISTLVADEDYWLDPEAGVIELHYASVWNYHDTLTVTYSSGWLPDDMPEVFRALCLEYATPFATNPAAVTSYTQGKISETFAATFLTARAETDHRLDKYRLGAF